MENKPTMIPRGNRRKVLENEGRIKKLQFFRSMTPLAVRQTIADGFSKNIDKAVYLQCSQNNYINVNHNQDLNGEELIELAGQGSIYLCEQVSKN